MAVQRGLNLGVALFIASEALFFFAIFWAFFHRKESVAAIFFVDKNQTPGKP